MTGLRKFDPATAACLWLTAAVIYVVAGCDSRSSSDNGARPASQDSQEVPLHSEIERGPVKVEVDVTPRNPRLSDEPRLTLTVTAEEDVSVRMPPFGQSMGEFVIRDFHEPLPRIKDGKQVLQQVYVLEPLVSGTLLISPLPVGFSDGRNGHDEEDHVVETEPLKIEVETMIGDDVPSLLDLRPPEKPVELPDEVGRDWLWGMVGAVLAVALIALIIKRVTRPRIVAEPVRSPRELALTELNLLLERNLEESDVKEFFIELTAVVRRYIERSTGVNAPDQTTEEFLREVNQQQLFAAGVNSRLEAFLESADLVKFAGFRPDEDAVKESTHRARQFIDLQTADRSPAEGGAL